jgi:hypothetical protein
MGEREFFFNDREKGPEDRTTAEVKKPEAPKDE